MRCKAKLTVISALFWDITQRWVVIIYQRFGTTGRSQLQGLRSPRKKMWLIGSPETSVQKYHSMVRNIPEELRSLMVPLFCLGICERQG
jgi:hypothetical protein